MTGGVERRRRRSRQAASGDRGGVAQGRRRDIGDGRLQGWLARTPTYGDVCSGDIGHAEAVQVEFDTSPVSYDQVLELFWQIHDPTTLNRQGPDVATQYRSEIFFQDSEQEVAARASKKKLERSGRFGRDIVTKITPASMFYRAEEYHQQYFDKLGRKRWL